MPFFFLIWTKRDICCQVSAQENPIDSSGVVFFSGVRPMQVRGSVLKAE